MAKVLCPWKTCKNNTAGVTEVLGECQAEFLEFTSLDSFDEDGEELEGLHCKQYEFSNAFFTR